MSAMSGFVRSGVRQDLSDLARNKYTGIVEGMMKVFVC